MMLERFLLFSRYTEPLHLGAVGKESILPFASMVLRFSLSLTPSKPVKRTEPCQSFGWLWQEAVRDIGALVILLHENRFMSRIASVIREDFEDKGLTLPANCQVFQLLPGEFITKLDAYDSDGAFVAVRFHTNMRVSQIFGCSRGKMKSIVAPPGQYIHHPTGTFSGKHCVAIGALFTPLGRPSTLVARTIPSEQLVYSAIPQSETTSGIFVELRKKTEGCGHHHQPRRPHHLRECGVTE